MRGPFRLECDDVIYYYAIPQSGNNRAIHAIDWSRQDLGAIARVPYMRSVIRNTIIIAVSIQNGSNRAPSGMFICAVRACTCLSVITKCYVNVFIALV